MGRPRKDAFDEETGERVLRAAERIFGEQGYASARLADIAAEAGIRRPSLLYHFKSKATLYGAVIERTVRVFGAEALAAAQDAQQRAEPTAIVDLLVDRMSTLARGRPALLRLVARALIEADPVHDQVKTGLEQVIGLCEASVLGALPAPPRMPLRPALTMLISDWIMRVASGEPGASIWGDGAESPRMARWLIQGAD
jgi:TetR/AcrR family transcriptional regulator